VTLNGLGALPLCKAFPFERGWWHCTGGRYTPHRRQLTVLFCDLVGSTPLSQARVVEDRNVQGRGDDRKRSVRGWSLAGPEHPAPASTAARSAAPTARLIGGEALAVRASKKLRSDESLVLSLDSTILRKPTQAGAPMT
jgi:hypothetical protein